MKILVFIAVLCFCFSASAQSKIDLPAGAFVIEKQVVNSPAHPNRGLVLWMTNEKKNPRETPEDVYTCPEETRGSFYSGATRVSLVDTETNKIINTVKISDDEEDSFDIPYSIHRNPYYYVAKFDAKGEGKPQILRLKDYNGDGKALEFALFDAQACMGLQTALFGYSEKQDKVIQYVTDLKTKSGKSTETNSLTWVDYLFSKKPVAPGFYRYEIDYRGRGGTLDKYEIRYNAQSEKFEGTLISRE